MAYILNPTGLYQEGAIYLKDSQKPGASTRPDPGAPAAPGTIPVSGHSPASAIPAPYLRRVRKVTQRQLAPRSPRPRGWAGRIPTACPAERFKTRQGGDSPPLEGNGKKTPRRGQRPEGKGRRSRPVAVGAYREKAPRPHRAVSHLGPLVKAAKPRSGAAGKTKAARAGEMRPFLCKRSRLSGYRLSRRTAVPRSRSFWGPTRRLPARSASRGERPPRRGGTPCRESVSEGAGKCFPGASVTPSRGSWPTKGLERLTRTDEIEDFLLNLKVTGVTEAVSGFKLRLASRAQRYNFFAESAHSSPNTGRTQMPHGVIRSLCDAARNFGFSISHPSSSSSFSHLAASSVVAAERNLPGNIFCTHASRLFTLKPHLSPRFLSGPPCAPPHIAVECRHVKDAYS
ncbi:uncharacterized protein LOC116420578 [Sarcophilus harrisii]|uniref:uncharacterized protein LOC116420578 n=1 Tax=Sarcophilus harrisii TaxID=9305 RepID=UPI001301BF7A|nr:uncharacterized protein LOC116420578 [Sarcophilus harrisii]